MGNLRAQSTLKTLPSRNEEDLGVYDNDRQTLRERKEQVKKNKTFVYDMARQCADYMKNNEQLYKDTREALRDVHQKKANFDYVQKSLADLDMCEKRVLPQLLDVSH